MHENQITKNTTLFLPECKNRGLFKILGGSQEVQCHGSRGTVPHSGRSHPEGFGGKLRVSSRRPFLADDHSTTLRARYDSGNCHSIKLCCRSAKGFSFYKSIFKTVSIIFGNVFGFYNNLKVDFLLLAHLSQRLKWAIVIARRPSSVRPSSSSSSVVVRKLFTFSTSAPELLDGYWWNLVGMKYPWSLTSVVVFRPDPPRGGSKAGQK